MTRLSWQRCLGRTARISAKLQTFLFLKVEHVNAENCSVVQYITMWVKSELGSICSRFSSKTSLNNRPSVFIYRSWQSYLVVVQLRINRFMRLCLHNIIYTSTLPSYHNSFEFLRFYCYISERSLQLSSNVFVRWYHRLNHRWLLFVSNNFTLNIVLIMLVYFWYFNFRPIKTKVFITLTTEATIAIPDVEKLSS